MAFTNITNLPAESRGEIRHWAGLFQENMKKSENVSMQSLTKKDFEKNSSSAH